MIKFMNSGSGRSVGRATGGFPTLALILTLALLGTVRPAPAADLTPEEQALLAKLDTPTIQQAVALAKQVDLWRKRLEALRKPVQALADDPEAEAAQEASTDSITKVGVELVDFVKKQCPQVRPYLRSLDRLEGLVRGVEQAGQTVQDNEDEFADIGLDVLRDDVRDLAMSAAEQQVLQIFDTDLLSDLNLLRNPADFARNFLENEIQAKYFDQPYTVGDVQFKLVRGDLTRPLFSEAADIGIVMSYASGIELRAHGLYFQYKSGSLPEPRFNRVKCEAPDLAALSNLTLKSLGDAIPTLGSDKMGIKIVKPEFLGFSGDAKGGIRFGIEIGGFLDFADVKLSADDIRVYPDGKRVDVKDLSCNFPTVVPVANTGLIFDGYGLTLRPREPQKQVSLKTFLATAAGGKQSLSLDIVITFGFPIQQIEFEGALVLGRSEKIGKVTGRISLTGQEISGTLDIPDPKGGVLPVGDIMKANFKFKLDREGFTADGLVSLYRSIQWQMDLALMFDGNGSLTASEKLNLCGVNAEASFATKFTPGFKTIDVEALLNANVDVKLFRVDATVQVKAHSPGSPAIDVLASALGAKAEFTLDSLDDLTPLRVGEELAKQLGDMLANIAEAASQWEKDKKVLLANWDRHWKDELHNQAQRLGIDALRTGNPEVDKMLGDLSRDGKALGGFLSDTGKKSGKEVSEFIKNPAAKVKDLPGNVQRELGNLSDTISGGIEDLGGLFGGKKKHKSPAGPSPEELKATEWTNKFNQRMGELVAALSDPKFRIDVIPVAENRRASGQKLIRKQELHVAFGDTLSSSEGNGGGSIGFTVRASGFRSAVNTRSAADKPDRAFGSKVVAGSVDITGLITDDPKSATKPKGRVEIPDIGSVPPELDASVRTRDKIQDLVERLLPEVELEGMRKLNEMRIAVDNPGDEPMTVWYHVRKRVVVNRQFREDWQPGLSEAPVRITIPAKTRQYLFHGEGRTWDDVVVGSALRIWGESESGERWDDYRSKDLLVVAPNASLNGERAYHATNPSTYVYPFRPKTGLRVFTERMVELKNETPETLTVSLRIRSSADGEVRWQSLERFNLKPGETRRPQGPDGFKVRGSRILFTAESPSRRYTAHERDPVWLIAESGGMRAYRAEKIGTYLHVFKPDTHVKTAAVSH